MRSNNCYLLVLIICLLLTPSTGFACGCVDVTSPESTIAQRVLEAKDKARAVFSGKVVAEETVRGVKTISEQPTELELVMVRFKVNRWWKGREAEEVLLFTGETRTSDGYSRSSRCDYLFKVGESYLVYAYEHEGLLQTDVCKRTKFLEKAGDDLRKLGEGKTPGIGEGPVRNQPLFFDGKSVNRAFFSAEPGGGSIENGIFHPALKNSLLTNSFKLCLI